MSRVRKVRIDSCEGNGGVTVASKNHRPQAARFKHRRKRDREIKAIGESILQRIGCSANLLPFGFKARLQDGIRDPSRCERFETRFCKPLRALRAVA